MSIYGQPISEVHDSYRELLEVFCPNEALELPTNLCLEVAWNHVILNGVWLGEFLLSAVFDLFEEEGG